MQKLEKIRKQRFSVIRRNHAIVIAAAIGLLITLDLLATRQVIPVDTLSEPIFFVSTVIIAYGIGSFVLFIYVSKITKEIRQKSTLIRIMHIASWGVQFSLLSLLIIVIYTGNTGFLTSSIYTIASISACVVMSIICLKFFSWYNSKNKNKIILIFALTSAALALSVAVDAGAKLFLVQIAQEASPLGSQPQSSFLYQIGKEGKIQYKEIGEQLTKVYYVPNASIDLYHYVNLIPITISFILRWMGCTLLLRHHYNRKTGLTVTMWVILLLPLILYLIGKVPDMLDLPSDYPYRFYFRILFRIGTIGGSVLFGLAFYVIARGIKSGKVKDYLATTAMGITLVGISLSTSALQQTYGVAGHSLVLLSSYLFGIGLYCSALSVIHDYSLRQVIRNSMVDLLKGIGAAEIEQKIKTHILKVALSRSDRMLKDTGIPPSITEDQMKEYASTVLREAGILENMDEIIKKEKEILNNSLEYSLCSRNSVLELARSTYFDAFEKVMEKSNRGRHKGIRFVTYIDTQNLDLAKEFTKLGVKIRHVKNLPPIDFALSDRELIATIDKERGGAVIKNLLISNEPIYIEHFSSFFEELWNRGIDSKARIRSIEEGLDSEGIEIIQDPRKIQETGTKMTVSANEEILGIFSTNNAFHRQERVGLLKFMEEAAARGVKIRILTPFDDQILRVVNQLNQKIGKNKEMKKSESPITIGHLEIRPVEPSLQTRVSILVVDKKYSLSIELKDDTQESSVRAIGLATYSNSKPTVLSYVSTFESLWSLSEMYEKLKLHDKVQKEFINVAAHELRTPIQPIIGLSQILELDMDDVERHQIVETIIRNAKRLQSLTEDLLDVAKIEAQTMHLKKDNFNLLETISSVADDFKKQVNGDVKIICEAKDLSVDADRERISQVIQNLVSNAIKFTSNGTIMVTTEERNGDVFVRVRDSGTGIDPEVLPVLFTKFVTKSNKGTGLGLYISKSIIEAHGGKIWAENNADGAGASFTFRIPRT
jgi:signal transduction histidine kinase